MRDNSQRNLPKTKGVIILAVSILLIWLFMFYIGPWAENIPMVRPLLEFIEENDIDASAFYYTDIEEFAEAEFAVNQSMAYSPRKN